MLKNTFFKSVKLLGLCLMMSLPVPTFAAVVVDGFLLSGSMQVDYFPHIWRKQPQFALTAPAAELHFENYMSWTQFDRLTLATKGYALWSKSLQSPVRWEKARLQGTLFTKLLPYIHVGYTLRFISDKPDTEMIGDKKYWTHGISMRVAW